MKIGRTLIASLLVAAAGSAHAESPFVSRESATTVLNACKAQLEPLGIVCIRGKDWGLYPLPIDDWYKADEWIGLQRRVREAGPDGAARLAIPQSPDGRPTQPTFGAVLIYTADQPFSKARVTHIDFTAQTFIRGGFDRSTEATSYLHDLVTRLPVIDTNSSDGKQYLRDVASDNQAAEQKQEQEASAARMRTTPKCTFVRVNGVVSAGSVMQLEQALHASDVEDIVARNPITCRGDGLCYGVSFVANRQARILDWSPDYVLVLVPIDFDIGRRDMRVFARRSAVQCIDKSKP